jgi:hypothetical protein
MSATRRDRFHDARKDYCTCPACAAARAAALAGWHPYRAGCGCAACTRAGAVMAARAAGAR